jgi:O-methyltransferase domain/Dimerisation domain
MWPSEITENIFGCVKSQVFYVCHDLGVFQYLIEEACGSAEGLSKALSCDEGNLARLMNAACTLGLLVETQGRYSVNPSLAEYLDKRSERYCGGFIGHMHGSTYEQLRHLSATVKSGQGFWNGEDSPFDKLYGEESLAREFITAMWNIGFGAAMELVDRIDLSSHAMLVDIGGASGSFSVAALKRFPNLSATIFDLAPVGKYADETRRTYDLESRLRFKHGDFWRDDYPEGDVYVFGYILSDWTTEEGIKLLQKARDRMSGGKIIILEKLFDDIKSRGPQTTAMADITMMVETRGMHRTAQEYIQMLNDAAIGAVSVIRSTGDKHMIVGQV